VQAQHVAMSNSPEEDVQQVMSAAVLAEEVTSPGQRQSWPPPGSLHAAQPDSQDSPDVSPTAREDPCRSFCLWISFPLSNNLSKSAVK